MKRGVVGIPKLDEILKKFFDDVLRLRPDRREKLRRTLVRDLKRLAKDSQQV